MKQRGFSLVELTIAMGVMVIVFSLAFTTYITTHKLWKGGFTQITLQARGRIALGRIAGNLRSSVGATILNSGDRIRFVTDPNRTPGTSTDDITADYYISGTDIVYDPDVSVSGDESVLLSNVNKELAIPFFQISGDLIVVTFKLYNSDSVYGTHWSSMSTSIKMRNV